MTTRLILLLAGLAVAVPLAARAEDFVSYKYQDYSESGGRIQVQTQGAYLSKDLGTDALLKFEGVIDAIAGATPTGQLPRAGTTAAPTSQLTERRKAWSGELSGQLAAVNVAAGFANSRESDYVSDAWSLNTRTDFNQKNTTLLVGYAGVTDRIKVSFQPEPARKRSTDLIVGLRQLWSPETSIQLNVSWGRARGFLSDQYKVVEKNTEVVPGVFLPLSFLENRPPEREKRVEMLSVNSPYIEMAYRHYGDTFGIDSDSVELTWFLHLAGDFLVVQPSVRSYRQSAADFYYYNLNNSSIVPRFGPPRVDGPYYSSDYRLSALSTETYGLKLVANPRSWLRLDAAVELYRMKGRDRVTPRDLYPRATILTFGGRATW